MGVINTNQLKSALERLCLVVPKRATLPVLENLRWRAAKGHLELAATDLDNRLHISIPFVGEAIDSDADVLVPAKELCQLVKTESDTNLKIRIRNGKCEVSASKRKVVLSCAESSSFPEAPDGEMKPQGQILGSAFDGALRRALFCVSIESGRYSTDVLKLELRGSIFRIVGTDGHRLSVVEGTARTTGDSTFWVLLLRSTVAILSRLGLADESRWVDFPPAVPSRNSICSPCRMALDSSPAGGRASSRITRTSCPRPRSKPEWSSGVKNCWKASPNSRPPLAKRKCRR